MSVFRQSIKMTEECNMTSVVSQHDCSQHQIHKEYAVGLP